MPRGEGGKGYCPRPGRRTVFWFLIKKPLIFYLFSVPCAFASHISALLANQPFPCDCQHLLLTLNLSLLLLPHINISPSEAEQIHTPEKQQKKSLKNLLSSESQMLARSALQIIAL